MAFWLTLLAGAARKVAKRLAFGKQMKTVHRRLLFVALSVGTILLVIKYMIPILLMIFINITPIHRISEVQWLPEQANVLFFKDNHGGFHGDGTTYLSFTTETANIPLLIEYFSRSHGLNWETNALDQSAIQTINGAAGNLKVPPEMKPDPGKHYIIGHKQPFQMLYYTLVIIDADTKQVWYIRITT